MKKYLLSGVLLCLVLVSCKNEKKAEETEVKVVENPFSITVTGIVEKNDSFQIYYNEDGTEAYDGTQMINLEVVGSPTAQELVFKFPENEKPLNIRFDIGNNPEQKQVKFNGFKIEYKDKSFSAVESNFFKYFYSNGQVELDTVATTAKIKILPNETYDPIIGATPALKAEIEKLYK